MTVPDAGPDPGAGPGPVGPDGTPEAGPGPPGDPPRRRRGYFGPGLIALAVLLAIGTAIGAGDLSHPAPKTLRGADVASQLSFGIAGQAGVTTLPPVSCPARLPVREGYRFRCRTSLHGVPRTVEVVEIDRRGNLRWNLVGG